MSASTANLLSRERLGVPIPSTIRPGSRLGPLCLRTVAGEAVHIPSPDGRLTHLQFLRWAGCSICSLGLADFKGHAAALERANVREVIVFHSSAEDIHEIQSGLPFDMVADPGKSLYQDFGVGSSPFFLLHPRTIATWFRSLAVESNLKMTHGPFGLPADFLIAPDGEILAMHYGRFADDSWKPTEVLALAQRFHDKHTSASPQEDSRMTAGNMPATAQPEADAAATLTAKKILALIAFTVPIWFLAAMFIRFRGPHGIFTGVRSIVLYLVTIPLTMLLNRRTRLIVHLPRHQLPNVIAVTSATAILLDGFAMNRFPALYGGNPAVIAGGAAWLLWAVGVALALALVSASSSPRR